MCVAATLEFKVSGMMAMIRSDQLYGGNHPHLSSPQSLDIYKKMREEADLHMDAVILQGI